MRSRMLLIRLEIYGAGHIDNAIREGIKVSLEHDAEVIFDFSGDDVIVDTSDLVRDIRASWEARRDERQRA